MARSPTIKGLEILGLFAYLKGKKQWEKPFWRNPNCDGRESGPFPNPAIPIGSLYVVPTQPKQNPVISCVKVGLLA